MLQIWNIFFLVFHTVWMLFNCVGWAWRRTRRWHLITTGLTAASWFLVAWWFNYPIGYCLCTDWHWQVREKLGYPRDYSYTHFLFLELTGIDVSARLSDRVTGGVFLLTTVLTLILNIRDLWQERRSFRGTVE